MTSPSRYPTTEEINELARLTEVAAILNHQALKAAEEALAFKKSLDARMPLPLLKPLEEQDDYMKDGGN